MNKIRQRRLAQRFTENITILRAALETIDGEPGGNIRWTPLIKRMYELSSPWQVNTMIYWLRREGYLHRPTRGVYTLTRRGASLLEALRDPAHQPEA